MAQYGIMRVEKRGRCAVYGLQIEANRTQEEHARGRDFDRSDIDWTLTGDNIHLVRTESWGREITRQIREAGAKERKDSIVLLDGLYTASAEWFEEHSREEAMAFFRDCLAFHVREYCGDDASRVINAVVHLDEATPHLQVASVPIIEDEKGAHLSAKVIMGNKRDYRLRQDRFYEQVTQARGMERGDARDDAERKAHTTKREWQISTQEERAARLENETLELEAQLSEARHILEFFPNAEDETAVARAMERAYEAWRDDTSQTRNTLISYNGKKMPRDVFFLEYSDECERRGFLLRDDMANHAALPTSMAIAVVAANFSKYRRDFAKQDSNFERVASHAVRKTADDMKPVLTYIGIPEKRHTAVCRECGDELDRQSKGEPPKEIPSIGATVDFREVAKTADASMQVARASSAGAGTGQLQARLDALSQALDAIISANSGSDGIVNLGGAMAASAERAKIEDAIGVLKSELSSAEAKAEASAVIGR